MFQNDDSSDDSETVEMEYEILDPCTLTVKQWAEIRGMALQLFENGYFAKDQFKVAVQAFCYWMAAQPKAIVIEDTTDPTLH